MNILHVGLMVDGRDVGLARELRKAADIYTEISTGEPDLNQKIIMLTEHRHFDFAFFQIQAANIIHPSTFEWLRERGIFTINWSGDIRRITEHWFYQTGADLTCFSNERDIQNMQSQGLAADFLQIGIDPDIFKKRAGFARTRDVVFMGNNYGGQFPLGSERAELCRFLQRKGWDIFGSYPGALANLTGNQIEESRRYNITKIAINHSHFNVGRYTSDRMFRILGSGTFCLSHHYEGIEKDFQVGYHLDTYHSWKELDEKIRFYLGNETEREEIAQNGHNLCYSRHTYEQMAGDIISLFKKHKS